jgi:hypothetical protein
MNFAGGNVTSYLNHVHGVSIAIVPANGLFSHEGEIEQPTLVAGRLR